MHSGGLSKKAYLTRHQIYNTIVTMMDAMAEYYYTDDNNQVKGTYSFEHIMILRQEGKIFDDTQVCKKGESKWLPLGEVIAAHSKARRKAAILEAEEEDDDEEKENLPVPELLNLANLPATCRLVRVVCRFVIACHVIALVSGIGAGIGCLFKHANPALGALIGLVAGCVASYIVLKKIEDEQDD